MKTALLASGVLVTLLAAPLGAQAHGGDRHHGYWSGWHHGHYCADKRHRHWKKHHHGHYYAGHRRGWDEHRWHGDRSRWDDDRGHRHGDRHDHRRGR